jgi:hypothetical protein
MLNMLRTRLAKSYIKRTIRPLYGWTQTTPKSVFLDPAWDRSVAVWPGMVFMKTAGENVSLIDGTGLPYGLGALYVGGDGIDEVLDAGINAFSVWVLGPDAEFEILAPAFDVTSIGALTPAVNGTEDLLHAGTTGATRGMLVAAGAAGASTDPVCRLLKVNSPTKITIGGLRLK